MSMSQPPDCANPEASLFTPKLLHFVCAKNCRYVQHHRGLWVFEDWLFVKAPFLCFPAYNALAVSKSGISALHMRTQVLDMSTNTFQCGAQPTGLLDQSYPPLVQHGLLEHAGTSTMASSMISLENPPSMVDFPVCSYGFPTCPHCLAGGFPSHGGDRYPCPFNKQ
jgi:hypothetical protein